MHKTTWLIIAFNAISIILDIISSEALWSTGIYVEGNSLFYVLGKTGFYLLMTLTLAFSFLPLTYLDTKDGRKFRVVTLAIAAYGVPHLVAGVQQLIIYAQLILGGA